MDAPVFVPNPLRSQHTKNVTTRQKHKKPSVEEAKRVRLLLHPSYVPAGGAAKDRQLYPCCVPTGRFVYRSCERCDPFCEGRLSAFIALGSGPTSYWKNLKTLLWAFFIMSLFMLPSLVINVFNKGELTASIKLVQTTMAGLTPGDSGESSGGSIKIPWPGSEPRVLTRDTVAMLYSLCDLGASLVFLLAYLYARSFSSGEERQVDKSTVTARDYTVFLPWVPRDTTEEDLLNHFRHVTTTEVTPEGLTVSEAHLVEDNTTVVGIFVERGRVFRQIERLQERVLRLEDQVRHGQLGCTVCFGGIPGTIQRLKRAKEWLSRRADTLSNKATLRASNGAVAAFVTFEETASVDYVLKQYPRTAAAWCCQPKRKRLVGHRIEVIPAPPPASVLWSNLAVGACEQRTRQTLTGMLTAAFLIGSFVLLWFASWKQQQYISSKALQDCGTEAVIARLQSGALNATYAATLPAGDGDLYCYCGSLPWNSLSARQVENSPFSSKCPAFSCPAYFNLNPAGISVLAYCVDFIGDRALTIVLTVAASLAILVINSMLAVIMRLLTSLEAHKSFEDLNASLQLRLFFAQFFNTALLLILVNVAWPGTTSLPEEFKTGKWEDLTSGWYTSVGTQLLVTMIINIFTPHIYSVLASLHHHYMMRQKGQDAPSQRDLNERFVGPYADWSVLYARLANVMFVCFVFSTGMPLLIPIALVSFAVSYWVDKLLFLWYFRRPPTFGSSVQKSFVSLMPVALILHLAWGAWAISYGPLLDWTGVDPLRVQNLAGMAARVLDSYAPSVVSSGASRLTKLQALPLLVLFVVMVSAFLLHLLLGSLARFIRGAFHIITCQAFVNFKLTFETEDVHLRPTYTEACNPRYVGTVSGIVGLPSYNILLNPEIMSAFAISPEWAASHKTLSEVALYKIGTVSMAHLPLSVFTAPLKPVSVAAELAIARAKAAQDKASHTNAVMGDSDANGYGFGDYEGEALGRSETSLTRSSSAETGTESASDGANEASIDQAKGQGKDGVGGTNEDEEEEEEEDESGNGDDQEFGGYMAGVPPSMAASTRRMGVPHTFGAGSPSLPAHALSKQAVLARRMAAQLPPGLGKLSRGSAAPAAPPVSMAGVTIIQRAAEQMQEVVAQTLGMEARVDAEGHRVRSMAEQATSAAAMLIILRQQLASMPPRTPRYGELSSAIAHLSTFVTLEALALETAEVKVKGSTRNLVGTPVSVAAHAGPSTLGSSGKRSEWAARTAQSARKLSGAASSAGGGGFFAVQAPSPPFSAYRTVDSCDAESRGDSYAPSASRMSAAQGGEEGSFIPVRASPVAREEVEDATRHVEGVDAPSAPVALTLPEEVQTPHHPPPPPPPPPGPPFPVAPFAEVVALSPPAVDPPAADYPLTAPPPYVPATAHEAGAQVSEGGAGVGEAFGTGV